MDRVFKLRRDHAHYYQVQSQLGVWQMDNYLFVVWTEHNLHVEQIMFDVDLWGYICKQSYILFKTAVFPELVSKFFSRISRVYAIKSSTSALSNSVADNDQTTSTTDGEKTWCSRDQIESGSMICCDNVNCSIQCFHYVCIGIERAPRGKWFYKDCRKLPQF